MTKYALQIRAILPLLHQNTVTHQSANRFKECVSGIHQKPFLLSVQTGNES